VADLSTTDAGSSRAAPAAPLNRRVAASYVFAVYLMAAASETFVSPFFPLIRRDFGLVVAEQAVLVAILTCGIGVANLVGGAAGYRVGDRVVIRVAAAAMSAGAIVTGTAGSFAVLLLGQAIAGLGIGLFFAPGLASIGRMFVATRGRAVASYGLGYSIGTAAASFSAGIDGIDWRWPYYVTAVLCASLVVVAPPLLDSTGDAPPPMLASLRGYLRQPLYQMSMVTALVAGSSAYIFLGFLPQLFVDRGASLTLVATLIGVGRLASVGAKWVAGWMFDRFGGARSASWIMLAIAACGVPLVALPGTWGAFVIVPFVVVMSSLFPISNALSVAGLPERSTWGIGVYRAVLVGSSAALAGVIGTLLQYFSLDAVMYGSLLVPASCAVLAVVMTRAHAGIAVATAD